MPKAAIPGPVGSLEARYHKSGDPAAPVAIVLHPNPQFGGDMNNRVVYALFTAFKDNGFSVLRFNYRGVGRSEGEFGGEAVEVEDAEAVLEWWMAQNPQTAKCWMSGFSYGCLIGMKLMSRKPDAFSQFIAIAPPAQKYDFGFFWPSPAPGLLIHGTGDSLAPEADVLKFVEKLQAAEDGKPVEYQPVEGATHFFDQHLDTLSELLNAHLKKNAASN